MTLATMGCTSQASAITVRQFPVPVGSNPLGITAGPDGNMWFTELTGSHIGRISPSGHVTDFSTGSGISTNAEPWGITTGPDGNLWFTEQARGSFGHITPLAVGHESPAGVLSGGPRGITTGPDGNLWITDDTHGIVRANVSGTFVEFKTGLHQGARPVSITTGSDGNLWFTEVLGPVGRITPTGTITEFGPAPDGTLSLGDIAAGPDGNLWFTRRTPAGIGRITPAGVITIFTQGLDSLAQPRGITTGPDGNLWFTDEAASAIGRSTPEGAITMYPLDGARATEAIAPGPDGTMWVTTNADTIARVSFEPTAVTGEAAPGTSFAVVNGAVTTHFVPGRAWVEYGTTAAYGSATPAQPVPTGEAPTDVRGELDDLTPGATYHYRVVGESDVARVGGADRTFTVPGGASGAGGSGGGSGGTTHGGGGTTSGGTGGSSGGGATATRRGAHPAGIHRAGSRLGVTLRCPAGRASPCAGTLRLVGATGRPVLAHTTFRVPVGATRVVRLSLGAGLVRRIAGTHGVRARLLVIQPGLPSTGTAVRLR